MKQIRLFKDPNKKEFGSDLNLGKRKEKRPLSFKTPIHLILKSESIMKFGTFKKHERKLLRLIYTFAESCKIKIHKLAVHVNHIHLVIEILSRESYNSFIRALTGAMVTKLKFPKRLFNYIPYTRIVAWGKDFQNVLKYTLKNRYEAEGKVHYFDALYALCSNPRIPLRIGLKKDNPAIHNC